MCEDQSSSKQKSKRIKYTSPVEIAQRRQRRRDIHRSFSSDFPLLSIAGLLEGELNEISATLEEPRPATDRDKQDASKQVWGHQHHPPFSLHTYIRQRVKKISDRERELTTFHYPKVLFQLTISIIIIMYIRKKGRQGCVSDERDGGSTRWMVASYYRPVIIPSSMKKIKILKQREGGQSAGGTGSSREYSPLCCWCNLSRPASSMKMSTADGG